MKGLNNITYKYIKASKSRTKMILIGIILSIALITSISIVASSIQYKSIRDAELNLGKFQGGYNHIDKSQMSILKENFLFDSVGESINFGLHNLGNDKSIRLLYGDNNALDLMNFELLEGSYPTKYNEIALEEWVLEKMNVPTKLGENIEIKYQNRFKDKYENPVEYQGEDTFILSGILKNHPDFKERPISEGIISNNYIESNVSEEKIGRMALVTLKKVTNAERTIGDIGEQIGLSDDFIFINMPLINAQGGNMKANIPFILLGILVVISTIVVIYNMFYISVVERINQFGMFRSLGATPRQIRGLILNEGLIFSVIGIPIGLLCGYILSYLIVPLIPINGEITMASSPYIIPIVAAIGLFTIMISVLKPSKLASKVSPIEALRSELLVINNGSSKFKNRRLGNLFGIIGKMSYQNLWRNRKRTWMTIISLTLSCTLFIVFSTIFTCMNIDSLVEGHMLGDYTLTGNNRGRNGFSDDIIGKLDKIEGIESYYKTKFKDMNLVLNTEEIGESFIKRWPHFTRLAEKAEDKKARIDSDVFGYQDSLLLEMKNSLVEGKIPLDSMKENLEILIRNDEGLKTYHVGDKVNLELSYLVDEENDIYESITKTFNIVGIIDDIPTYMGFSNLGPQFIIHEELFDKYFDISEFSRFDVNVKKDSENVESALNKIINQYKGTKLKSFKEEKAKMEKEKNQMMFLVLTLVIIIAVIGILNMINTMITSIISRRKEFGMLRAVGMTNEQLKKMIRIEGMYYGLISAVLSSIIGSFAAYGLYNLMKKEATYMIWKFPILQILSIFVGVIIISIISTQSGLKRVVKNSVVESIRVTE